jgi:dUTP pyrophosphatase
MVPVQIKKLSDLARSPEYETPGAAGFDLCYAGEESHTIYPYDRILVPTGLAFAIPEGYEMQIRPRSGLAFKFGLTVLNAPGTIDSDYRGEVKIILQNQSDREFEIEPGMRVAQGVLCEVPSAQFIEVEELPDTDRGAGGFGSTGHK